MRNYVLILMFLMSLPVFAENSAYAQTAPKEKGVLIREISMDGFVLGDKERFIKIFKPYRNKYLTTADMDDILQKIELIYEREGYQQLVTISYQVIKRRLVYTALMTS